MVINKCLRTRAIKFTAHVQRRKREQQSCAACLTEPIPSSSSVNNHSKGASTQLIQWLSAHTPASTPERGGTRAFLNPNATLSLEAGDFSMQRFLPVNCLEMFLRMHPGNRLTPSKRKQPACCATDPQASAFPLLQ